MKKLLIVVSLLLIIPLVFGGFALDFVTNTKSGSLKVDAQDVVVNKYGMRLDESLAGINEDLDLCLDGVENLSENGDVFDKRLSATEKVVDSCVEDIEDLSGEVSNFEGRLSETEDTLGSCVEDIESLLANGGSGSDKGFCLAKINSTDGVSGTIEMLNGSYEDVLSNPASLFLVLDDAIFFSYKGVDLVSQTAIYECSLNISDVQVVYRCTLLSDGTCNLEVVPVCERSFGTIILDEETFSKLYLSGESVTGSIPSVSNAILDYFSFGIILEIKIDEWRSILLLLTFSNAEVLGESFVCVYEGCCELSDLGALCVRCVLREDGTYILSRVLFDESC